MSRIEWELATKKILTQRSVAVDQLSWWQLPFPDHYRLSNYGYVLAKQVYPGAIEIPIQKIDRYSWRILTGQAKLQEPFFFNTQMYCTWNQEHAMVLSLTNGDLETFFRSLNETEIK